MVDQLPKTTLQFIIYSLDRYKLGLLLLVFLSCMTGGYGIVNSYMTKMLIDSLIKIDNDRTIAQSTIWLPAILLVMNYELHNLLWRGINYLNIRILPLIYNDIIQALLKYTYNHAYSFFQENAVGSIESHISRVADSIIVIITNSCSFILRGIIQFIIAMVVMYFVHPIFCIALTIWFISFCIISIYYSRRVHALSNLYAENKALLTGQINDSLANIRNVKLFTGKIFEIDYLANYLSQVKKSFCNKEWFLLKLWWLQGASITALIAVTLFTLINLRTHYLVTIGDFALILGLILYVSDNMWWLTVQVDKINDAIGQCDLSLKILLKPYEITDVINAPLLRVTEGKIEFENVRLRYRGNINNFECKSVVIAGGQKVGLVGLVGSGKTSFASLLVRLFDVNEGRILIDGQNIASVSQDSLHGNIGCVPQDQLLFHRSIFDNIRYGKFDASYDEVVMAAQKAHAHEFIMAMPDAYNTIVGEKGAKLSGGQRQLIAIARMFLRNAPILILDESTSQLDSITESLVHNSLAALMRDKTTIIIAHHLSTLLNVERILVFDKGHIVQDGTHQQLLAQDGLYSLLWQNQYSNRL
jgi:ATP-binding cassette subfamily B protein